MTLRIFILFLFSCRWSFAQPVFEVTKTARAPIIGKYIYTLEDKNARLSVDDVRKKAVADQFVLSKEEVLNYNITRSAIWCRFTLTGKEKGLWFAECMNISNNGYNFYIFKNDSLISSQRSGIPFPKEERKVLGGHVMFDIPMEIGDTLTCYLKVMGSGPIQIPIRVSDVRNFFNEDHSLNLVHGMYFGIMLLMVLYNLFLFFTNRTRVYIYYILYIIFSTIFIAFFMSYVFSLPEFLYYLFNNFPVIIPAFFGFFGLLFTIEFLNTKDLAPKLHRAIMIFLVLVLVPVIVALFGYAHESVLIIQLFGIILATLSFASGITVLRKGYRPAKFYVIGFGSYMLGLVTLIVTNTAHLSLGGFENYALEVGSAIEAIMLSFAIGDKLNIANHDKQIAQTQAFEAMKENEKLIREQNSVLEQKVKERTAELEEQKDIVEEKNKEIVDSIKYAKRIQSTLLPSEKFLEKNLLRLKRKD